MSAVDYGYGDAPPDSSADYGYGDAAPDSNDYGYGDAAPDPIKDSDAAPDSSADYGYGDAAPDTIKYADAAPDNTDYGYGDAAPNSSADYGYGDAAPDNNAAKNDSANGVQKVHVGLNDAGGTRSLEGGTPRKGPRYRRRGSVTKYSLNTVEDVKKEYNEHEDMINQFRNQALVSSTADHSKPSYGANSVDSGDLSSDGDDLEKKKKNKKGFMKFARSNKESSN